MPTLTDWFNGTDLPAAELTPGTSSRDGAYESDLVFEAYKAAILEWRAQYPYGLDYVTWDATLDGIGPLLVADDANEIDHGHGIWVPSAGAAANPVLGTGGSIRGEVWQHGKEVRTGITTEFGPNTTSASYTNVAVNVSTNVFTRSGHTLTNGMAVLISNRGTAILPASDMPDGCYFVRNANTGAGTFELEVDAGSGTSLDVTGTAPGASIHLDAVAASKGTGVFWRHRLLAPVRPSTQHRQGVIGDGHIFLGSSVGPFGPGSFRTTALHVADSVSDHVCGLVIGANLPPNNLAPENALWALTNHSDDRAIDENAPGAAYDQTIARELRHAFGTAINDMQAATTRMTGDNVGPLFPWGAASIAGARIVMRFLYPAA